MLTPCPARDARRRAGRRVRRAVASPLRHSSLALDDRALRPPRRAARRRWARARGGPRHAAPRRSTTMRSAAGISPTSRESASHRSAAGLGVALISGALLFFADVEAFATSRIFWMKMALVGAPDRQPRTDDAPGARAPRRRRGRSADSAASARDRLWRRRRVSAVGERGPLVRARARRGGPRDTLRLYFASTGSNPCHTFSATICSPAVLGWMPSA